MVVECASVRQSNAKAFQFYTPEYDDMWRHAQIYSGFESQSLSQWSVRLYFQSHSAKQIQIMKYKIQ